MLRAHGLPVLALLRPGRCGPAAGTGGQWEPLARRVIRVPDPATPCLSAWACRNTPPADVRVRPRARSWSPAPFAAVLALGTLRVRGGSSAVGCSGRWGPGCRWA